jgi:hypothetical protein
MLRSSCSIKGSFKALLRLYYDCLTALLLHTGHAEEFMQYQNTRGGKVVLKPLAVPPLKAPFKRALIGLVYSLKRALNEP